MAILVAAAQIVRETIFEWSGVHMEDAPIYTAVGRAITQGLVPYKDLFETKPPGIFLLYAASLKLFDSDLLVRVFHIAVFIFLPFILALSVRQRAAGFLFGCILSLYLAYSSGELQVESYGIFFSALFILSLRIPHNLTRIALGAFSFAGAVGMKEPFLLSILASVLILQERFILPIGIGMALGAIFMASIGFIEPYFSIYLPYMVGFHTLRFGSPILRAFNVLKIGENLFAYSPFLLLLICTLIVGCMYALYRRRKYRRIAFILLALFLTSFAVGTGGEYMNHHFMFALPTYISFFILFMDFYTPKFLPILLALCLFHAQTSYSARLELSQSTDRETQREADLLDAILDSCRIERYRILGDIPYPIYGYTRHIPLGSAFFQYPLYMYETGFKDSFIQSMLQAQLIVIGKESRPLPDAVVEYINQNFTSIPPTCGKTMDHFVLLFRLPR